MEQALPHPATTVEMYLSAILDELKALRPEPAPQSPAGVVELREPASEKAPKPRPKRG